MAKIKTQNITFAHSLNFSWYLMKNELIQSIVCLRINPGNFSLDFPLFYSFCKKSKTLCIYPHCQSFIHIASSCLDFCKSPKRLNILENIEDTLGLEFKLVQPGKTRWLSHERSLAVVLKFHQPLLLALESIYQDGMDLSSEAGGLVLLLHSEKTIAILSLWLDLIFVLCLLG
nr:uncharacterized protein LOC125638024 isoform X3 [Caretta caretta]